MITYEKPKSVSETVTEWAAAGTVVKDNVIPGVKILGFESPSHRRRYPIEIMRKHASMYENARVNIDHVPPGSARPTASVFGRIRNPRVEESRGLIGDLHFNPGHPLAAAVKWAAENDPGQYSLSHVADLVGNFDNDRWFRTKEIEKVHSVDVVSNGGTTSSLFESAAATEEGDTSPMEIKSMTREQLQAERQDLRVLTVTEAAAGEKKTSDLETRIKALEGENTTLKAEIDGLKAAEAKRTKDATRLKAIEDAKLPEHLVTETFKTLALEASDERFTALIAERKDLAVKTNVASSKSKTVQEGAGTGNQPKTDDAKGFANFLKGA